MFNRKVLLKTKGGWKPQWRTSASGRRFARNEEDTGTIMEWDDNGTIKYTIVFDAQYRTNLPYYSDDYADLGLPIYQDEGEIDEDGERKSADNYTDDYLNSLSCCTQDERSNHDATQETIVATGGDFNAVNYCRRGLWFLNPPGLGVDLPTINCLARIWADAEILDEMDPTVDECPQYSLTEWSFDEHYCAWSTSWYGPDFYVYYNALYIAYGYVGPFTQQHSSGVIPVLDIE